MADTLRTNRLAQNLLIAVAAIVVGLLAGALVVFAPFWLGFALLIALALGYALLRSTNFGLAGALCIAIVLPFGTLPFKAVVTPQLLELVLLALMGVWLLRLMVTPEATLQLSPLGLPVIGFLGLTLFSFILGSNGSPDSLLLHNYFKFVLAVLFFFSITNCVRSIGQAQFVLRCLIILGVVAALIGLVLFALPNDLSERLLVALGRFGYPTEGRVLRFVNDDIYGVERAIGLGVDPNSFGGMLSLVGAIAATQAVAERPTLPRWASILAALLIAGVTFLTQSRGALGGLVVGVAFVAVVRYRRLLWPMLGAALAGVVLYTAFGIGSSFVTRVVEGLQFRDLANQMRLAEFRNALAVIQAYPVFGIGFGSAPELDLVAGVSSIYLAMGQRIGLVGLGAFLVVVAIWFRHVHRASQAAFRRQDVAIGGWLLALEAGVVAALAVGVLDHYFFNIEFSHMATLLWGTIGLGMALESMSAEN
ncbi:polymerase [Chloroflexia bacterium SDU3-3]|nr:polymerase [Chloroflexia bacterium SDU3-3]